MIKSFTSAVPDLCQLLVEREGAFVTEWMLQDLERTLDTVSFWEHKACLMYSAVHGCSYTQAWKEMTGDCTGAFRTFMQSRVVEP